jgi:hypothetical protein
MARRCAIEYSYSCAFSKLEKVCVPMVSEDSTSKVMVLPVTKTTVSVLLLTNFSFRGTYGSSRRSAWCRCCWILSEVHDVRRRAIW